MYDALAATTTELKVRRDPECPICSREPGEISDEEMGVFPDYEAFCAAAGLGSTAAPWRRSRSHPSCAPRPAASARSRPTATNVGAVLNALAAAHPETDAQLFGDDGGLNRYVNVYLNDEDVRVLDGLDTRRRRGRHARDPAGDGGRRLSARTWRVSARPRDDRLLTAGWRSPVVDRAPGAARQGGPAPIAAGGAGIGDPT